MPLHEEAVLTMVEDTKALSVFLACGDCLSHIYDFRIANKDAKSRFKRFKELETPLGVTQENMTKAEGYLTVLREYIEHPEKFCDIDAGSGQKTYKNVEGIKTGFKDFVRDINVAIDTFLKKFIDQIAFDDPDKSHHVFTEHKPNSKKTPEKVEDKKKKFASLFKGKMNDANFDAFFDNITRIYYDVNEKRNFFEHHGKLLGDVISGNYLIGNDGSKLSVKSMPTVQFNKADVFLHEYAQKVFFETLSFMQNILALYANRICDELPEMPEMGGPRFFPIELILKECGQLPSHTFYNPESGQKFMFGYLGGIFAGGFMPYSGSRPQDPDFMANRLKKMRGE